MASELDDGQLHAEADAEVRYPLLACVTHRLNLALNATLAKAAGHQDGIHPRQAAHAIALDIGGFDVVHAHPGAGLQSGVHQRLVQGDVRVADLHVLADHGDVGLAVGVGARIDDLAPLGQIGRGRVDAQFVAHDVVQPLLMQQQGDPVDVVGVDRRDHRPFLDVGEQRDLAALFIGEHRLAAAQQHVGLDADRAQLLD